jgi:hypothetical protein
LLTSGAAARAQSRIPLACQNPRTAPASCARYYQGPPAECRQSQTSVRCAPYRQNTQTGPEIRQAPQPDRGQTGYGPSQDPAEGKIRDAFVDWGKDKVKDALPGPRTRRGKQLAEGYDAVTDPGGYLLQKELTKRYGKEAAEKLVKKIGKIATPGLLAADLVTTPIHNPKGYKDGQSRQPSNADTAALAYEGLTKNRCVPRVLLNAGPSASSGPAPGPNPSCASVEELTAYVNRYQKEFEQIAAQERFEWNFPRESMQSMNEMMAFIERQLADPSMDPELRRWAQQELRSLMQAYEQAYKRGVRPPDGAGSQSGPFANDPIHEAGQRIDSELSIKPWR